MAKIYISVVGKPGSGKSTLLADWRDKAGLISSKSLVELAAKEGITLKGREEWVDFTNAYRARPGNRTFIADAAINDPHDLVFIDGPRNMPDVEALEATGHHVIISIDADQKVRFERSRHNPEKYGKDFDEFVALEQAEQNSPDEFGPKTDAIHDMAGYYLDSSATDNAKLVKKFNDIVYGLIEEHGIKLKG